MTSQTVSFNLHHNIAIIRINHPPVNALSQSVRQGLLDAINWLEAQAECRAAVILCEGRTFIAGADISEFGKPPQEPHLPDVIDRIEACRKPVIAALHGTALGGGFEVALGAHYRIAISGSKVGLPEVTLGLIPGAGGTQRLPRVVGLAKALDMTISGKPVEVDSLLGSAIDKLVEADLEQEAIRYAEQLAAVNLPARPTRNRAVEGKEFIEALFADAEAKLAKTARGQEAPLKAMQALRNACELDFEEGMKKERELFISCRASPQSRAMRHAFFAERAVNKVAVAEGTTPVAIKKVGVIGAGTMGSGIAMCFASAGFEVVLLEMAEENLQRGLNMVEQRYQQNVDKGRITTEQKLATVSRISGSVDYQSLADVDLVVEAAFESMQVKRDIFTKLDSVCKPGAILATNTSYLDINEIAGVTSRPEHVVGMHFFSPAHVMKLLEVVKAAKTSDQTLLTAMTIGKTIGKISVAVGVCYGFVGNRMYTCYGREANALVLEGATPAQVDAAMQNWGMAMGPLSVADLSGIDIGYKARKENPNPPADPLFFLAANSLVDAGRLGQKTVAGFYDYDSGRKTESPAALEIIRAAAAEHKIPQRTVTDDEIEQRLTLALINEGCRILDEGIAARASDIDAIWLNGYGFPRFRGGPMCYADELGLDRVATQLRQLQSQYGDEYWKPSDLLVAVAESGGKLVER